MFTLKFPHENPTETYPTCFTMMPSEIQAGSPKELERPRANTKVGSILKVSKCVLGPASRGSFFVHAYSKYIPLSCCLCLVVSEKYI